MIGTRSGSGTRKIMLLVHYDTVFGTGDAAKRPYTEREGRAYGPGVADAKGGIAMILHLLSILETLRFDGYGTLTVVFNPDEERGSRGSRDEIARIARDQDVVLSFEPSFAEAGVDAVTVATKGINYASLTVKGRASHAGGAPEAGRNAVVELSHQILQLQDLGDPAKGTSLHWTVVHGGTKPNIIPDDAKAEGDMRYFVPSEYDRVLSEGRKIAESHRVPDTQVTFGLAKGRPPLPSNPGDEGPRGTRARHLCRNGCRAHAGGDRRGDGCGLRLPAGQPGETRYPRIPRHRRGPLSQHGRVRGPRQHHRRGSTSRPACSWRCRRRQAADRDRSACRARIFAQ